MNINFSLITHSITASAGSNGSIDPIGIVTKDHRSDQLFTATPEAGYEVDEWSTDNKEWDIFESYNNPQPLQVP